MPRYPYAFAAALIVLLASGCRDQSDSSSAETRASVRDSAGVRIVENRMEGLGRRGVDPQPVLSIGSVDEGPQALFRVQGVARTSSGEWAIANGGSNEVRYFEADGRHLRTVGREGEGPGEFVSIRDLWILPGDSLLTWDSRLQRATWFGPDGMLVRSTTPGPVAEQTIGTLVGALGTGQLVLRASSSVADLATEAGAMVRPTRTLALADVDGRSTTTLGEHPGESRWMAISEGFVSIRGVPFAQTDGVSAGPDRVVAGVTDAPEFRVWDAEGREVARWRLTLEPAPVTDQDWTAAQEAEVDRLEELGAPPSALSGLRDFFGGVDRPTLQPLWSALQMSREGELWVQQFSPPGGEPTNRWWVLGAQGELTGEVELPVGLSVEWIGEGLVAGIETDDLDVEYVRVYRLSAGS